jgi:hypothetical protein
MILVYSLSAGGLIFKSRLFVTGVGVMTGRLRIFCAVLACGLVGFVGVAQAYVGPGAGLSAIGSLVALMGTIAVAILGFIWFPIKRLLKSLRKPKVAASVSPAPSTSTLQAQAASTDTKTAPAKQ